jgi:predicted cupin superfamily sugar epimerase
MVTPGFDFKDFKLIGHKEFLGKYPQHSDLVYLARDEYVVS